MSPVDAVLDRLLRLHPKAIDLSLGRIRDLLSKLGNPHRRLPPVIHVAGTNGKGSVTAFLQAMLGAEGYRTHVYTSPHLVHFNERIVLSGAPIGDDELIAVLEHCEAINDGAPITFFEITTAAAFMAFSRQDADFLLLEVGLGGRLDTTNMVARPCVTAITPIALDHQHFLGDTLAAIAAEKAGILKPDTPAVIGPQDDPAAAVIAVRAAILNAPLFRYGHEWRVHTEPDGFLYDGPNGERAFPRPALIGHHQIENAGIAIACLDHLPGPAISWTAIETGLKTVVWPGRLQRLIRGPLFDNLPDGWEIWLDGGHNPAAGRALAGVMKEWSDRPIHAVIGMLDTKEADGFLAEITDHISGARTVTIPDSAAARSAGDLAARARTLGIAAKPSGSVAAAIGEIIANRPEQARILVCGSLYLAGSVLAENG